MGKLFVVIIFALAMCGITYHFCPGAAEHAFYLRGVSIRWMMMLGCVYLYAGHRLTGNK